MLSMKNLLSILAIFVHITFLSARSIEPFYEVAIVSIFRDEADWFPEWIEYHTDLGVEHFYLYDNGSVDDYAEVLSPYIKKGLVSLIPWTHVNYPKAHLAVIKNAIRNTKNKAKWLAVIDPDEYIVLHTSNNIKEFLKDYEDYAGLVMNWQIFGTSNVQSLNRGESMLRLLTWKFPTYFDSAWNSNHWVKTIIRPDRIDENTGNAYCGNHIFMPMRNYQIVNSDKNPQPILSKNPSIVVDKIQLNHYWMRTLDWFYEKKINRRETHFFEAYPSDFVNWILLESHSEQDFSIQRLLDEFASSK